VTIGNRFELIDDQLYLTKGCLNVYFYQQTSGVAPAAAADLVSAWIINVLPLVLAIQNQTVTHPLVRSRNLDVPSDFALVPRIPPDVGLYASASGEPTFVAASIKMNRTTQASGHGWKRYVGVPDNEVLNGVATPGYISGMNNLANVIDNDILGAAGNVYRPVIMHRILDSLGHLIGYQEYPMGTAQFVRISTQNTRK